MTKLGKLVQSGPCWLSPKKTKRKRKDPLQKGAAFRNMPLCHVKLQTVLAEHSTPNRSAKVEAWSSKSVSVFYLWGGGHCLRFGTTLFCGQGQTQDNPRSPGARGSGYTPCLEGSFEVLETTIPSCLGRRVPTGSAKSRVCDICCHHLRTHDFCSRSHTQGTGSSGGAVYIKKVNDGKSLCKEPSYVLKLVIPKVRACRTD